MPDHFNSFSSFSSSQHNSQWFLIAFIVIALHVGLLGIGTVWHPAPPPPKPRSKVIVQTVRLKPFQSATLQHTAPLSPPLPAASSMPTSPSPKEQPKIESPPISQPLKEEIPVQPEIPLIQEELLPQELPVIASSQEIIPPPAIPAAQPLPPPLPIKTESKPQPKTPSPKATVQETPKTPAKQSAPVKKPIETPKKSTKSETGKNKAGEEAEKKKQQQKIAAEKKKQQEQAAAEKKRQQEREEAEKKRQQELAAAQEVAQQRMAKAKENLAKIGETRDKISSSSSSSLSLEATTLPKELGSLHVDALPVGETGSSGEWGTKEMSYSDEVAYRLKMALRLPDYGAVKIKLTLDRTGKVVKVETIQSESAKNKNYVENKIPTLLFSSFGQRFQGVAQNTFVITLQNDN